MPTINFTSQIRLFIDFGSTVGGSGGSAVVIPDADKMDVTDEGEVKIVKAIGPGPAGHRETAGGQMLKLTINRSQNPTIRWRRLKKDKKYFMLMVQDENAGPREKFFNCRVSKVGRTDNAEGEHQDEVEIAAISSLES